MARFLLKAKFVVGQEFELTPEESHHLVKVLRMEGGEQCELVNGEGEIARAIVIEPHSKKTRCLVEEVRKEEIKNRIHIACAIPKSNALDFIIHRCTELGVCSFQPLISEYSLKINSWNEDRWERVVLETAKQCQETYFPVVLKPLDLKSWIFEKRQKERQLVYCDEQARFDALESVPIDREVDLLVGSEGGWSQTERGWFQQLGKAMGLGKNRLRAETACIVGLTLLKKRWNEL
ncbi:MAG: 16S rRNA (uracil(1498)-N(3))-methyltransferase [Deltaproteobacteria bacterium]|nr:16S rRNA (uracil(1498)-N(3))-methyltransferase [Deltaproteobacteria bacterium]